MTRTIAQPRRWKAVAPRIVFGLISTAVACAGVPSVSGAPLQPSGLIHDAMGQGTHPEFGWHANLVGWFNYYEGYMAGMPDIGWRSAVISDIRFDVRADTVMLTTRIDRNDQSQFAIGFTPMEAWINTYRYDDISLGVLVDDGGYIMPVWAAGDTDHWPEPLAPGIWDLRITLDRTSGTMTVEADTVGQYGDTLSLFSPPVWSASEVVEIDDFLYIQICPFNEYSAVYDVWSTLPTPSLLRIAPVRDLAVAEGDTVVVHTAADYNGDVPLVWTLGDDRFTRHGDSFVWATGPGDNGLYESLLSVTDGLLIDTLTVRYAVTHVYAPPVVHDRMNGLGISEFSWKEFNMAFWFTGCDGYLGSDDSSTWFSAVVSERAETLRSATTWVFRTLTGGENEYAFGLTRESPGTNTGYYLSIDLGLVVRSRTLLVQTLAAGNAALEEIVLPRGIHDIRITMDPYVGQARFEAAPVSSWADSISDFSNTIWSVTPDALLKTPAYLQINIRRSDSRVYDVWRMPAAGEPSPILEARSATGRAGGVFIEWSFTAPPEGDNCVVIRCPGDQANASKIAEIPLAHGVTRYQWLDDEARPGSAFAYRVYLESGGVMDLLFDTGPVKVPRAQAALFQNHPNPFNPSTTIEWYLPEPSRVRIEIFDVSGRSIRRLFDGRCLEGRSAVVWDGRSSEGTQAASGIYFCRIVAGELEQARKMVLLK